MSIKAFLLLSFFAVLVFGCNTRNQKNFTEKKVPEKKDKGISKDFSANEFLGTWISNRKSGFQMIEILDSTNAILYRFEKWRPFFDKKNKEKIAFYKANAKISYSYIYNLHVKTDRFHFNYFLVNDSLFEMAEPGRVDTLIKVYTDSTLEKYF